MQINKQPDTTPQASVILPIYNAEKYLTKAIDSILNQSFKDFELIMIDDGSSDNSLKIMKQYAAIDNRCTIFTRENRGLIYTLNELILKTRGEIIFRMDADDICAPTRFENQINYLHKHPECVALGTQTILIDDEDLEITPFPTPLTHNEIDHAHLAGRGGAIMNPSSAIRRNALIKIGGYSDEYPSAEDFDAFLKLAEIGELANLNLPLLYYRQHLDSIGYKKRISQINSTKKALHAAIIRRKLKTNFEIETNFDTKSTKQPKIIEIYTKWAWWSINSKNFKTAKKYALRILMKRPFSITTAKLWYCILRGH